MFRRTLAVELMIFVEHNVNPIGIFRHECFRKFFPVNTQCILVSRKCTETKQNKSRAHTTTYISPYLISDRPGPFVLAYSAKLSIKPTTISTCVCVPSRELHTTIVVHVVWTDLAVMNTEKSWKHFYVRERRARAQNAFSKKLTIPNGTRVCFRQKRKISDKLFQGRRRRFSNVLVEPMYVRRRQTPGDTRLKHLYLDGLKSVQRSVKNLWPNNTFARRETALPIHAYASIPLINPI